MKNKIKNQIKSMLTKLLIVILVLTSAQAAFAQHEEEYVDYYGSSGTHPVYIDYVNAPKPAHQVSVPANLVVPVRFRYKVEGDELEAGDGIALEIVENIYVGNSLVFRQGDGGTAKVSSIKKSGIFGRGGSIEINSGDITDIYGRRHLISLTSSTKGSGTLGPVVLTLLTSGIAVAAVPELLFDSFESTLFGAGLALAPVHFAMKKGKEAKVSNGKVMYARVISSGQTY